MSSSVEPFEGFEVIASFRLEPKGYSPEGVRRKPGYPWRGGWIE
jgi:hypothetical protein